ncbi:Recombination protein RecR [Alphaproteobacteria bacterium SO-S41]|nr:Recombination protein RecR [Alphaproteobacteria bacterium SO-S41]
MKAALSGPEIERLVQALGKLPGLGPRSARRAALALIKKRETLLDPLSTALREAAAAIKVCSTCGHIDTTDPCGLCTDPRRDDHLLCVVEDVGDVWALERAGVYRGRYHVLGGTLSALDGRGPDALNIASLIDRMTGKTGVEVVLALSATVEGQATAHYITERLGAGVNVTRLGHGVPIGGELGYLDEGTLAAAFKSRRPL